MQFDGKWAPQSKRTELLFRCIFKKVKGLEEQGKSEEAQDVIEKIGKIVGKETVLDNIATTISKSIMIRYIMYNILEKCKSAADLTKCLDLVVSGTTTEVHRIAEQAYSSFIIGNEDYKFVVMPYSSRDEMHTQCILKEIGEQIDYDKKTLDVFLNILKGIGAPVSRHADDISKDYIIYHFSF